MARPKIYIIKDIVKIIDNYVKETDLPILKEVCYQNGWRYESIMNLEPKEEDLDDAIKRLVNKKEAELERGGLTGKYNNTMAIFSLKQLGWKDKQEEEFKKDIENLSTLADLLGFNK